MFPEHLIDLRIPIVLAQAV